MTYYKGVLVPDAPRMTGEDYRQGWREGVDSCIRAYPPDAGTRTQDAQGRHVAEVVPASGDIAFVRAFVEILRDNQTAARVLIKDMSPRDRALLSWALKELSYAVDDMEDIRRMDLTTMSRQGQDI